MHVFAVRMECVGGQCTPAPSTECILEMPREMPWRTTHLVAAAPLGPLSADQALLKGLAALWLSPPLFPAPADTRDLCNLCLRPLHALIECLRCLGTTLFLHHFPSTLFTIIFASCQEAGRGSR